VWFAGSNVQIQRGSQIEQVPITIPAGASAYGLQVAHGGRRINYVTRAPGQFIPTDHSIVLVNGAWQTGPSAPVPTDSAGGTARSLLGKSHGGDSALVATPLQLDSVAVRIQVQLQVNGVPVRTNTLNLPGLVPPKNANEYYQEQVFLTGAYPMVGRKALLAVNRQKASAVLKQTVCPSPRPVGCQESDYWAYAWTPKHATLYRVHLDVPSLQIDSIGSVADSTIYDVAYAEDEQEKLVRVGRDSLFDDFFFGSSHVSLTCRQTWSRPGLGSAAGTFLYDSAAPRRLQAQLGCLFDINVLERQGWATNAPRVGPARRLITVGSR
jgi:hypothetical protein